MNWYLKKADGQTVYGPVDEKNLEAWAADGRVAPDDQVSADRREWKPAPAVPALKMEWVAQLPGGKQFGPVPSQAFRELIRLGELKPDTPVRSAKSGQTTTVCALMAGDEKPSAAELKWKAEAETARKAAAEAEERAGRAAAELKSAQETLARTEQDRDQALRRAAEAEKQVQECKDNAGRAEKAAQEQLAAAQAAARESSDRLAADLKTLQEQEARSRQERDRALQRAERAESESAAAIEKARSRAEKAEQDAAEDRAAGRRQAAELQAAASQLAAARAEIGTWKEQCERARAASAEAEKARQAVLEKPAPPADLVPRGLLEEARRRIVHLERGYKQALQSVQRSLSARVGASQAMPPEQLRRRDIA